MTARFTKSVLEDTALEWVAGLGYAVLHGRELAPGDMYAERRDFGRAVLDHRLGDAVARLNPVLPANALNDASRERTWG